MLHQLVVNILGLSSATELHHVSPRCVLMEEIIVILEEGSTSSMIYIFCPNYFEVDVWSTFLDVGVVLVPVKFPGSHIIHSLATA